jgi:DNA replication protein DnaC
VRGFIDEPFGFLTLWGGPGNGKTLALMAAVNEFRRKGKVAVYVTFVDLLDYMREGFKKEADHDARYRYEQIARADVLAIDEIDKANMTLYAYEFRTRLLDDRYRAAVELRKHTLFALNASPEATMEPHLYDRLRDGRFVVFRNQDPSMRPAMARMRGF